MIKLLLYIRIYIELANQKRFLRDSPRKQNSLEEVRDTQLKSCCGWLEGDYSMTKGQLLQRHNVGPQQS